MIRLPVPPERWSQLAESLRLPVLAPTREALASLAGGTALRAERVAALAVHDPGLALELLRAANSRLGDRACAPALADGVETVSHGVMLLGVESALKLALALPVIDPGTRGPAAGMLETLATAHVAGALAARWAARGGRRSPEAHRVAAQACLLGDLAAWSAAEAPEAAFSALARMAAAGGDAFDQDAAERHALGSSCQSIAGIVARAWRLPLLVSEVLDVASAGTDRAVTTTLAARLAAQTRAGWNAAALEPLIAALAVRLAVEPDEALHLARHETARAAREFHEPRLVPGARHLALAGGERISPEWLTAPPPPTAERPAATGLRPHEAAKAALRAAPPREIDPCGPARDRLARCRAAIRGYLAGRLSLHESMQEMVNGMRSGLALDRVVLALLSRDRKTLVGRFGSEHSGGEFLRRFHMDLTREHLFTELLRRRQALDVNPENRLAVWARLPPDARPLLSDRGFYAMSIFVRERPVGVFYADWHASRHRAAGAYEEFKELCTHTEKALERAAA